MSDRFAGAGVCRIAPNRPKGGKAERTEPVLGPAVGRTQGAPLRRPRGGPRVQEAWRGVAPTGTNKRANRRERHRPCFILVLLRRQHQSSGSLEAPEIALRPKQGTARSAEQPHSSF